MSNEFGQAFGAWLDEQERAESSGNPNQITETQDGTGSRHGLHQISDAIFKQYGDPGTNIYGREANRTAAGRHLMELLVKYKDPAIAAGAYHAGEGAVDSWRATGQQPREIGRLTENYMMKFGETETGWRALEETLLAQGWTHAPEEGEEEDEPGVLKELGGAFLSGLNTSFQAAGAGAGALGMDPKAAAVFATETHFGDPNYRRPEVLEKFDKQIDSGDYKGATLTALGHPIDTVATMMAQGGGSTLMSLIMAAVGGFAGLVTPVPGATAVGGLSGLAGGTLIVEGGGKVLEVIHEALNEHGMPVNAETVAAAFNTPELMEIATDKGLKKGLTVAMFEAASALFGGVLLSKATGVGSAAWRGGAELGAQTFTEGFQEWAGEKVAGDEAAPSAVVQEAVAGGGLSVAEVGAGTAYRMRQAGYGAHGTPPGEPPPEDPERQRWRSLGEDIPPEGEPPPVAPGPEDTGQPPPAALGEPPAGGGFPEFGGQDAVPHPLDIAQTPIDVPGAPVAPPPGPAPTPPGAPPVAPPPGPAPTPPTAPPGPAPTPQPQDKPIIPIDEPEPTNADDAIDKAFDDILPDHRNEAEELSKRLPWQYTRDQARRLPSEEAQRLFWHPTAERIYKNAGTKDLQGISDYYAKKYGVPSLKIEEVKNPMETRPGGYSITGGLVRYRRDAAGNDVPFALELADWMHEAEKAIILRHEIEHMIDMKAGFRSAVDIPVSEGYDDQGNPTLVVDPGHHQYYDIFNYDYPHRIAVREALAAGEAVPEEVLADYPELLQQEEEAAPAGEYGSWEEPNVERIMADLGQVFVGAVRRPGTVAYPPFRTIVEARKWLDERLDGDIDNKRADELIEAGIVGAARQLNNYADQVKLYGTQPNLSTRTGDSVRRQAYSTPAPLAFAVQQRLKIGPKDNVLEPTAGTGMLVSQVDPTKVWANEIDPFRRKVLQAQGFLVLDEDASAVDLSIDAKGTVAGVDIDPKYGVVLMNPPFGRVYDDAGKPRTFTDVPGIGGTQYVDHAIALKQLETMDENGRAVIILGSKLGRAEDKLSYGGSKNAAFYKYLYDTYKVTDHFAVSGDLYKKMGAGFPVDVIVIEGKGQNETTLPYPHGKAPPILRTWNDVERFANGETINTETRDIAPVQPGGGRPGPRGGPAGPAPGPRGVQPRGGGTTPAGDTGGPRPPGGGTGVPAGPGGRDAGPGDGGRPGGGRTGGTPSEDGPGPVPPSGAPRGPETPPGPAPAPEGGGQPEPGEPPVRPPRGVSGGVEGLGDDAQGLLDDLDDLLGDIRSEAGGDRPTSNETAIYERLKPRLLSSIRSWLDTVPDIVNENGEVDFPRLVREVIPGWARELLSEINERTNDPKRVVAVREAMKRFAREIQDGEIALIETELGVDQDEVEALARKRLEDAKHQITESELQGSYIPMSGQPSLKKLAPKFMRDAAQRALVRLVAKLRAIPKYSNIKADSEVLDQFVSDKLKIPLSEIEKNGYFSGEQMDALAMGIDNHESGGAFIIGDQTGVGKGRFVAGMLKYAHEKGLIPVFVTEGSNLYGDMYRDINAIGWYDFNAFPTNQDLAAGKRVPLPPDPVTKQKRWLSSVVNRAGTPDATAHKNAVTRMTNNKKMDDEYDAIFTTYKQLNPDDGRPHNRHSLIRALAPNSFIVMDESHEAGGSGDTRIKINPETGEEEITRAGWFRELLSGTGESGEGRVAGVIWSSATFAKRAENMDLYARSNIRHAVDDISQLESVLNRGGLPLMQFMSAGLVEDRQLLRRENDFTGISIPPVYLKADPKQNEAISGNIRDIYKFDTDFKNAKEAFRTWYMATYGVRAGGHVQDASQVTTFGSTMHNLSAQSVLSMKADQVADAAIEVWKKGDKPVIALHNTQENTIKTIMKELEIDVGDDIGNFSLANLYERYHNRSIEITINRGRERVRMTPDQIAEFGNPHLLNDFLAIQESIRADTVLGSLSASPIDTMTHRMERAGIKVGELTGRAYKLDIENNRLAERKKPPGGKNEIIDRFNNDEYDALILNQSGSTGFSIHAAPEFKSQKPRHMLMAQPMPDITIQVQVYGRINRSGQKVLPKYGNMVLDIPAEVRPNAITQSKLSKLGAITTAQTKSGYSEEGIPADFFDVIGVEVVRDYMVDNPDLAVFLDVHRTRDPLTLAKQVTGRATILPVDEDLGNIPSQRRLFDELAVAYRELLEQKIALGENPLEATLRDLQAEVLSESVIFSGDPNVDSVFAEPAMLQRVESNKLVKPLTEKQMIDIIRKNIKAKETTSLEDLLNVPREEQPRIETVDDVIDRAASAGTAREAWFEEMTGEIDALETAYLDKLQKSVESWNAEIDSLEGAARAATDEKARAKINATRAQYIKFRNDLEHAIRHRPDWWRERKSYMRRMLPGQPVRLIAKRVGNEPVEAYTGIVLGWKYKKLKGQQDPLRLSRFSIDVALASTNGNRIVLRGAQFLSQLGADQQQADLPFDLGRTATPLPTMLEQMASMRETKREKRFLVTGNILAGYSVIPRGDIITYTTKDGQLKQGVLLPPNYDPAELRNAPVKMNRASWIMQYLNEQNAVIHGENKDLTLEKDNQGNYTFHMGKQHTQAIYTNTVLKELFGQDFQQRTMFMMRGRKTRWVNTTSDSAKFKQVVEYLVDTMKFKFHVTDETHKPAARRITGAPDPAGQFTDDPLGGSSRRRRLQKIDMNRGYNPRFQEARSEIVKNIKDIVKQIAPQANLKVVDRIFTAEGVQATGAYDTGMNLIRVAIGYGDPTNAVRHEAIHALKQMGLITDKEWQILTNKARGEWLTKYNIAQHYASDKASTQIEESIAQSFADYRRGVQFPPGIRRVFERITQFLQRVANMLAGNGFQTWQDVFESIESGEVGQRYVDQQREIEAGTYYQNIDLALEEHGITGAEAEASRRISAGIGGAKVPWTERFIDKWVKNWKRRAEHGVLDDLEGIKYLEKLATKGALKLWDSAYKLARLSRGSADTVFSFMTHGIGKWEAMGLQMDDPSKYGADDPLGTIVIDESVRPPMQILDDVGKDVVPFELYLTARRVRELQDHPVYKEKLFAEKGEGGEFKYLKEEIDTVISTWEKARPDFIDLHAEWMTYNDKLLDFVQASGLINEKTRAQFEEWHKNYIPFNRVMGGKEANARAARMGFSGQHPAFMRIFGGEENIEHPLVNYEHNVHRLVEMSIKNVVMQRTIKNDRQAGAGILKKVPRSVQKALTSYGEIQRALEEDGLIIEPGDEVDSDALKTLWTFGHRPKGDNIVSVVENGKVQFYEVSDPLLFNSLTQLSRTPIPVLGPLRFMRKLLTRSVGMDPNFQIANILRDTLHVALTSHIGFRPFLDTIRGAANQRKNNPFWRAFRASGGSMSSLFEADRPSMSAIMEEAVQKGGVQGEYAITSGKKLMGVIERFESKAEYATRVGVYIRLREQGMPHIEAAYQARELATDFAMRGSNILMRTLADTVPFLNAGVQGLGRGYRGFREAPVRFMMKGSIVAAASMALMALNKDDERYKKLPKYVKDANWVFFSPDPEDTRPYTMPKPFEVGFFFGTFPELFYSWAHDDMDGTAFRQRWWWNMTEMLRLDVMPQAFKPMQRIYSNWDEFRERPVVPDYVKDRSPEYQFTDRTSTFARAVASVVSPPIQAITGKHRSGVSPLHIETVINGYLGPMGALLLFAGDAIMSTTGIYPKAPTKDWSSWPIIRRLVGPKEPYSTSYGQNYYEMKEEVETIHADFQQMIADGELDRARKLLGKSRKKIALRDSINKINRQLQNLNRTMSFIRRIDTDADAKKKRLDQLRKARNRLHKMTDRLHKFYKK